MTKENWKNVFKLIIIWIVLTLYAAASSFQAVVIFALTLIIWRVMEIE